MFCTSMTSICNRVTNWNQPKHTKSKPKSSNSLQVLFCLWHSLVDLSLIGSVHIGKDISNKNINKYKKKHSLESDNKYGVYGLPPEEEGQRHQGLVQQLQLNQWTRWIKRKQEQPLSMAESQLSPASIKHIVTVTNKLESMGRKEKKKNIHCPNLQVSSVTLEQENPGDSLNKY